MKDKKRAQQEQEAAKGIARAAKRLREWDAVREARAEQEAEQAFERLAAFGPGVDVVNILTGQRYRT
jgi:hypothetical protein